MLGLVEVQGLGTEVRSCNGGLAHWTSSDLDFVVVLALLGRAWAGVVGDTPLACTHGMMTA